LICACIVHYSVHDYENGIKETKFSTKEIYMYMKGILYSQYAGMYHTKSV